MTTKPDVDKPKFVYVIYIASTPEKVWHALTDAETSARYWFGNHVESDWAVGSTFMLKRGDKHLTDTGTVLESAPPRRLSYTFRSENDGVKLETPSRVTFEIEQQEDQVKLTLVHDGFEPGSKVLEDIGEGWPLVLSSLKSLLESGRVLRALWYEEAIRRDAEEART
jgi:uncharacterized protein YndB with AHSA1/START domain